MTPTEHRRCKSLFLQIVELSEPDRVGAIDALSREPSAVAEEVKRLLARDAEDAADEALVADLPARIDAVLASERTTRKPLNPHGLIGQTIGPYLILSVAGEGGMGVVYVARDQRLNRQAALKAVHPDAATDDTTCLRLKREARVLASLNHTNIATIYGLEESAGALLVAMEWVDGVTLAERMRKGVPPIAEALALCEQIAAGVEAAHNAGVIHRDLKPANVMVNAAGHIKVLDFGLARETTGGPRSNSWTTQAVPITRQGSLFGTPAYMSPEQAAGEPLDHRSDIFAFGLILFRCLAGRAAFQAESDLDLMDAIIHHEPDWSLLPARIPSGVRRILERCLQKRPSARYQHLGDARLDLQQAIDDREWDRTQRFTARPRKKRFVWAAVAGVIGLAVVAGAAGWIARTPTASTAAPHPAQRFDLAFPGNSAQRDLERVQIAIAPDGKSIIAACETEAGQALWIRSHADGLWKPLEQTTDGHRPTFSPDGQWVNFMRDGHLFKQRTSGKSDAIRLLTAINWHGASWADDGTFVAAPNWGEPLSVIRPGSTTSTALTTLDASRTEFSHLNPLIVPGTRWVLYTAWTGSESCAINIANLDTGESRVLIGSGNTPRHAKTPRGDYLLFDRASTIYAVPFDPALGTTTRSESAIVGGVMNDGTRFAAYFDVADDGTLIYVPGGAFAEENRLSYVTPEGKTVPLNDDRLSYAEPLFSADGTRMSVMIKGTTYRCMVYDLIRGTREYVLTGGDTVAHALSPDGKTLACTVNRDGGYGIDLFSLADGRHLRRIVQPGVDYQSDLCWSDDGKSLTFTMSPKPTEPRDVWVVNVDDPASLRPLVSTPASDVHPVFAPGGKRIAYSADHTGKHEVYLINSPDGDRVRQVSFGGGECPAFSPDGKYLYYVSPQGLVRVELSADGNVVSAPSVYYDKPFGQSDPVARSYTIAPNGQPVVVEPSERRPTVSHLSVITNWHQLLP